MFTSRMRVDIKSCAKKKHHQRDQKSRQHSNVSHSVISLLLVGHTGINCKTGKWYSYSSSGLTAPCETSHSVVPTYSCPCCFWWWEQALFVCFCPKPQADWEVDQQAPFLPVFLSDPLSVKSGKSLSTAPPPFSDQCNWSCVRAASSFFALIAQ